MSENKLTEEQIAVLEQAVKSADWSRVSIILEAVAGSGKTFILQKIAEYLAEHHPHLLMQYLTFNKILAVEAQSKLPSTANARTVHSATNGPLQKFLGRCEVDIKGKKDQMLMDDLPFFDLSRFGKEDIHICRARRRLLLDAAKKCKMNMTDHTDQEAVMEVFKYYGLWSRMLEHDESLFQFLNGVRHMLDRAQAYTSRITFDDMIWLAVKNNVDLPKYDVLLVDEIQDANMMQLSVYERMLKPRGFIIGVGDPWQAIYGFAGARNDSFYKFKDRFECKHMTLSVNFRCPSLVIDKAARLNPLIKAHDGAIEGEVGDIEPKELTEVVGEGDLVQCRRVAPLVPHCLKFVRQGQKATIAGSDELGNMIIELIKDNYHSDYRQAVKNVDNWLAKQMKKLEAQKYRSEAKEEEVTEKAEIVQEFIAFEESCDKAIDRIKRVFRNDRDGVTFTSIHRAKGREAPNVAILEPDRIEINHKDMTEEQRQQEKHGHYVALTRPTKSLSFVVKEK